MADHMFMIPEGIFGSPLGTAATYVSLFVLFSSLLQGCGMGDFIQDVALGLTGRSTGGPAKVAVISSAAFGTISGAAAANCGGHRHLYHSLDEKVRLSPGVCRRRRGLRLHRRAADPPRHGLPPASSWPEYIGVPYSKIMLAAWCRAFCIT